MATKVRYTVNGKYIDLLPEEESIFLQYYPNATKIEENTELKKAEAYIQQNQPNPLKRAEAALLTQPKKKIEAAQTLYEDKARANVLAQPTLNKLDPYSRGKEYAGGENRKTVTGAGIFNKPLTLAQDFAQIVMTEAAAIPLQAVTMPVYDLFGQRQKALMIKGYLDARRQQYGSTDTDMVGALSEGNIDGAAAMGIRTVAGSLPISATYLINSPLAFATTLMSFAPAKYFDLIQQDPNIDNGTAIASAINAGFWEAASETIGNNLGFLSTLKAGKNITADTMKSLIKKELIKRSGWNAVKVVGKNALIEGVVEEAPNFAAEYLVDVALGINEYDPDAMKTGLANATLLGMAAGGIQGGAAVSYISLVNARYMNLESKLAKYESMDISNIKDPGKKSRANQAKTLAGQVRQAITLAQDGDTEGAAQIANEVMQRVSIIKKAKASTSAIDTIGAYNALLLDTIVQFENKKDSDAAKPEIPIESQPDPNPIPIDDSAEAPVKERKISDNMQTITAAYKEALKLKSDEAKATVVKLIQQGIENTTSTEEIASLNQMLNQVNKLKPKAEKPVAPVATETTPSPTPVETETVDEIPASKYANTPYKELQSRAKELGLKSVGVKKADLISQIEAKESSYKKSLDNQKKEIAVRNALAPKISAVLDSVKDTDDPEALAQAIAELTKLSRGADPQSTFIISRETRRLTAKKERWSVDDLAEPKITKQSKAMPVGKVNETVDRRDPSESGVIPKEQVGKEVTVVKENQDIKVKYALVNIDDVVVSNNIDDRFGINPEYPPELQNRNREEQKGSIIKKAMELRPDLLEHAVVASDGRPIAYIDTNGRVVIIAGNERGIAIKLRHKGKYGDLKEYASYIRGKLSELGIADQDTNGKMLVAIYSGDIDLISMARLLNVQESKKLSNTEMAKSDATEMANAKQNGDDIFMLLDAKTRGLMTEANKPFIDKFIEMNVRSTEIDTYIVDGEYTTDLKERIENALFMYMFNNNKKAESLLAGFRGTGQSNVKSIIWGIISNTKAIVRLRNLIAEYNLVDLDITDDMLRIVSEIDRMRADGRNVEQAAYEMDIFSEGQELIPDDKLNLYMAIARIKSQTKAEEFIAGYYAAANVALDPEQMSFMAKDVTTKEEFLNEYAKEWLGSDAVITDTKPKATDAKVNTPSKDTTPVTPAAVKEEVTPPKPDVAPEPTPAEPKQDAAPTTRGEFAKQYKAANTAMPKAQLDAQLSLYDALMEVYAKEMGITLDEAYAAVFEKVTADKPTDVARTQEEIETARQMQEVRAKYQGTDQWMKAPNGELSDRQRRIMAIVEKYALIEDNVSQNTSFYHGGLPANTTIDGINIEHRGMQQGKKGKDYGGFYLTTEKSKSWAEKYAMERGGVLHKITLKPNAVVVRTEMLIDRMSSATRLELSEVADLIIGREVTGKEQAVLLNKEAIKSMVETRISPTQIKSASENIKSATANKGTFDPSNPDIRFQQIMRGYIQEMPNGKFTIGFLQPDFSTGLHEMAHLGKSLMVEMAKTSEEWANKLKEAEDYCGVVDGIWTTEAEEKFALAFEKYLLTGSAPTSRLAAVLDAIKKWMAAVVGKIQELAGIELTPGIIDVYNALLGIDSIVNPKVQPKNERVKNPPLARITGYNYGEEIEIANTQYGANISTPKEYMEWWNKQLKGDGGKVLFERYGHLGDIRAITLGMQKYLDTIRAEFDANWEKAQNAWIGDSEARRMWVNGELGYTDSENDIIDELIHTVETYYNGDITDENKLNSAMIILRGIKVGGDNIGVMAKNRYGLLNINVNAMQGGYIVSHEDGTVKTERMPGAKIVGTKIYYMGGKHPSIDELIDDIIMQKYIEKNAKPKGKFNDEGIVSGSQLVSIYPTAKEYLLSQPKLTRKSDTQKRGNLTSRQKAEVVKVKAEMKKSGDTRADVSKLQDMLETLLDKFPSLTMKGRMSAGSTTIYISDVNSDTVIVEAQFSNKKYLISGKEYISNGEAYEAITSMIEKNAKTNSVRAQVSQKTQEEQSIIANRKDVKRATAMRKIRGKLVATSAVIGSPGLSEKGWRDYMRMLMARLIRIQYPGATPLDMAKLEMLKMEAEDASVEAFLNEEAAKEFARLKRRIARMVKNDKKFRKAVMEYSGYEYIEDIPTIQIFEAVRRMSPQIYEEMMADGYIDTLVANRKTISETMGIDINDDTVLDTLVHLQLKTTPKTDKISSIVTQLLLPHRMLAKWFGKGGVNTVVLADKGNKQLAKMDTEFEQHIRGTYTIIHSNSNHRKLAYTPDEADAMGRTFIEVMYEKAVQVRQEEQAKADGKEVVPIDPLPEIKKRIAAHPYGQAIHQKDIDSVYEVITTMFNNYREDWIAMHNLKHPNAKIGIQEFYIPTMYMYDRMIDQIPTGQYLVKPSPAKGREASGVVDAKLLTDLYEVVRNYHDMMSKYLSYYELNEYMTPKKRSFVNKDGKIATKTETSQFQKDTSVSLYAENMASAREYLNNYIKRTIGYRKPRGSIDKIINAIRIGVYASNLAFNVKITAQNGLQRLLVYSAVDPEAASASIKDVTWWQGTLKMGPDKFPLMAQAMASQRRQGDNLLAGTVAEIQRDAEEASIRDKRGAMAIVTASASISEKILTTVPFSKLERGNRGVGFMAGLYQTAMRSTRYKEAKAKGMSRHEAIEYALQDPRLYDAAVTTGSVINAEVNTAAEAAFSPEWYSNVLSKLVPFTRYFHNFMLLMHRTGIYKSLKSAWNEDLFMLNLSGEQKVVSQAEKLRALQQIVKWTNKTAINDYLRSGAITSNPNDLNKRITVRQVEQINTEMSKLLDEYAAELKKNYPERMRGAKGQAKRVAGLAAFLVLDATITMLYAMLRNWIIDKDDEKSFLEYMMDSAQVGRIQGGIGFGQGLIPNMKYANTPEKKAKAWVEWAVRLTPLGGVNKASKDYTNKYFTDRMLEIILDE